MTTPSLVPFAARHIEPALALYRRCPGVGLSAGDSAPEIAAFLGRNPGFSAVVEAGADRLLGAVLCGHDGRRGFLYHLAVDPEERWRGFGRALVRHCTAALAAANITRVSIHVFACNSEGQKFWATLGWRERADLGVLQLELSPSAVDA